MSALPITHLEEPRLARLLTKVTGWQHLNTDVVKVIGRQDGKVLVQTINPPHRTVQVQEKEISFSCECDDQGPAVHLVQTEIRKGTVVEYLLCDECYASEQYIQKQIEWQQIHQPLQETPPAEENPMPRFAKLSQADLTPMTGKPRRKKKAQPEPSQEEGRGLPWKTAARGWRGKAKAAQELAEQREERAGAWCQRALDLEQERDALKQQLQEALAKQQTINIYGPITIATNQGD